MKFRSVLVIDDSDADLLYTQVVLQGAQLAQEVITLGTAQEALAYLQRPAGHLVDLILLDINMPEMDGFAFLHAYERLHKDQQAGAVVVMLTSSPDPVDRERALAFGCVKGYVVKPIDLNAARGLGDLARRMPGPG